MPSAVLKDVTPENAAAELMSAGVRPGERVTLIVQRRSRSLLDAVDQLGAEFECNGMTEREGAEIAGISPEEFERLNGRPLPRA